MTVEKDLRDLLLAYSGLAALVGDRVFAVLSPQNTPAPRIVFKRISTQKVKAMVRNRPESKARFQFDCIATTFDGARAVAKQLNDALDRCDASGSIITAFHDNENDFYEDAPMLYRTQVDFFVHYTE